MGVENIVRDVQDVDAETATTNLNPTHNPVTTEENENFTVILMVEPDGLAINDHGDVFYVDIEDSDGYEYASSWIESDYEDSDQLEGIDELFNMDEISDNLQFSDETAYLDTFFSSSFFSPDPLGGNDCVTLDHSHPSGFLSQRPFTSGGDFDDSIYRSFRQTKNKIRFPNAGKRKIRHLENVRFLETLASFNKTEDDDITIGGGTFRFSKLHESAVLKKTLNLFMNGLEDEISSSGWEKITSNNHKRKRNGRKKLSPGDEAFNKLTYTERSFFKQRNAPLGIINYLDSKIFSFFLRYPNSRFISEPLTSFERMILHGIAHYYGLNSISFNGQRDRLLSVTNPANLFQPQVNFSTYLEKLHTKDKN